MEQHSFKTINLKAFILIIYLGIFLISLGETFMGPFFPQEADKRQISQYMIGIILGVHPLFCIISALVVGKYLHLKGRKQIIIFGCMLQITGFIMLALIYYIPESDTTSFIVFAMIGRSISGIGTSMFFSTSVAFMPLLFNNSYQMKVSYIEMITGLGFMFGFIQGSVFNSLGGYIAPFFIISILMVTLIPFIIKFVPNSKQLSDHLEFFQEDPMIPSLDINQNLIKKNINLNNLDHQNQTISYKMIFFNFKIVITFMAILLPTTSLLFLMPTFSLFLQNSLNISSNFSGYIFGICSLSYMICCPLVGRFQNKINRKLLIALGLFLGALGNILTGPDDIFGIAPNLQLIVLTRIMNGVSCALVFIPTLPELMEILKEIYPNISNEIIGDGATAIWNSSWHFGEVLGPVSGGSLVELLGFKRTATFFGLIMASLLVFYILKIVFKGIQKVQYQTNSLFHEKGSLINQKKYIELPNQISHLANQL